MGQEGRREAGSRAKTGLEEPHGPRFPVTCLARDANRALCSPSLATHPPFNATGTHEIRTDVGALNLVVRWV